MKTSKLSVLISIKQRYVESILSGLKRAEIRRIFPNNPDVSRVYVYVPTPKRHVVGYFDITSIERCSIDQLWKMSGHLSALTKTEFFHYLHSKETGISIHFEDFKTLQYKPSLFDLRKQYPKFHPPQSFMYVSEAMEKFFMKGCSDS